jgi:hypothetical protein
MRVDLHREIAYPQEGRAGVAGFCCSAVYGVEVRQK